MRDVNGNGRVDQVTVVFDDALAAYSAGIAPWTLTNVPSGGTLSSVSTSGATATLVIAEGWCSEHRVGTFRVVLAASATGIRDAAGNLVLLRLDRSRRPGDPGPSRSSCRTRRPTARSTASSPPSRSRSPPTSAGTAPGRSERALGRHARLGQRLGCGRHPRHHRRRGRSRHRCRLLHRCAGRRAPPASATPPATSPPSRPPRLRTGRSRSSSPARSLMRDVDANGKVDRVLATFSETLASSTDTAPWTLTSVPSGGTFSSVSTSGATATLVIAEGAGAQNTAVGSFRVVLAASATGIRDAAGNLSSSLHRSRRPGDPSSSRSSCRTRRPTARSTASSPPSPSRSRLFGRDRPVDAAERALGWHADQRQPRHSHAHAHAHRGTRRPRHHRRNDDRGDGRQQLGGSRMRPATSVPSQLRRRSTRPGRPRPRSPTPTATSTAEPSPETPSRSRSASHSHPRRFPARRPSPSATQSARATTR